MTPNTKELIERINDLLPKIRRGAVIKKALDCGEQIENEACSVLEDCLAALKGQGWVSVDERFPEKCDHNHHSSSVLVWCPDVECEFTATYNHEINCWEHFGRGGSGIIWSVVSAWKPLPPPPDQT